MNQKVIDLLNAARAGELTAINQYIGQHYELEEAMYNKLGDRMKEIAIAEMKHAEKFAERILFLGGVPTSKPDAQTIRKQAIPEMIQTNISLETGAIDMYNDFARQCAEQGDHVSELIFQQIAGEEETHLDEFQNTADHLRNLGASYLATLAE